MASRSRLFMYIAGWKSPYQIRYGIVWRRLCMYEQFRVRGGSYSPTYSLLPHQAEFRRSIGSDRDCTACNLGLQAKRKAVTPL